MDAVEELVTMFADADPDAPKASGFVERELWRIERALSAARGTAKYSELYAAQQALAWALEPNGARSPYDMIMGTREVPKDCPVECHLPSSLGICAHCELQ